MKLSALQSLRAAARKARSDSDAHRREQSPAPDRRSVARGEALESLAADADSQLLLAESQRRAERLAKRRADQVAEGAGLQERLRGEAQVRREQKCSGGRPPGA